MTNADLLQRIREAAREIIGRNASKTVAWVALSEWESNVENDRQRRHRMADGKPPEVYQPAIAIIAQAYADGSLHVAWGSGEICTLFPFGAPPASTRVDSFDFLEGLEFERQHITAKSAKLLNQRTIELTTDDEGLSPDATKDFLDGGPIRRTTN